MEMDVLTRPVIDKNATTTALKSAVGLNFVIKCSAKSNPDPTVTFSKNGAAVDTNSTKKDGIVTAVYEVKSAVKSDFGEYLCIATNPHGDASKRIKIVEASTAPVEKKDGGLGNAAVAGIIICIILIILVVVDLFCCFFNNCGFSHCCFETFCATKGKKYAPADRDEEEMEEMKPKMQEPV
ncbi:neural cell adhesion molecule 1-A-like isoform X2 [Hydractinia symbiolongicarpus]|uniref:neural cell adhesion molecule 1-A-like isoform X2 n=1 Tax=Hydractinia symbiolongicarpus TaxID=13093 RepID=UPI002551985E|nr:neural cell adhesion molecule 1-A-like isoform X2 [Hydractinia symbiolongicarpus]